MKPPFSCLPSIRLLFGFRSSAVAFCICVLAGSASSARAQLSQQDVYDAVYAALIQIAWQQFDQNEPTFSVVPYVDAFDTPLSQLLLVDGSLNGIGRRFETYMSLIYPYIKGLGASSNEIARISQFLQERLNLGPINSLASNLQIRSDAHGRELLVGAPDLENLVDYASSTLSSGQQQLRFDVAGLRELLEHGISVSVDGGEISIDTVVDANILNWPEYYTGIYDEDIAYQLTEAPEDYETRWDSQISDSDDVVYDTEYDIDSPEYLSDVTNAVSSGYFDTGDLTSVLPVRDTIFDPITDQLIPQSALNQSFSSDILLLPADTQLGIPRLEFSTTSTGAEEWLIKCGGLMEKLYGVLFAVFVMWLIWHEYNYYFRTMA